MNTTLPGNPGANLWDMATQGSSYTRMPGQPPLIPGGPEGVVFGPLGTLCVDETGDLWKKGTDASLNTGWCLVLDSCTVAEFFQEQFPT